MPFPSSSPPPPVIRTPILVRTGTSWNTNPGGSVFGTAAPSMVLTGTNTGVIGYQSVGGNLLSATTLVPAAGADQAVRLQSTNGAERWAGVFVQMLQTTQNPFPGVRWRLRYRMALAGTIVPNTTGADSQLMFGFASDFGFVFSRPRGPGVWLAGVGDALPNWRVWAIDGDLGSGGSVTQNVDLGVALSGDPQTLEWRCGNVDGANFVEALIDGVLVYSPTIPVGAAYPTGETPIAFQAGVLRGADAADVVSLTVLDAMAAEVFLEEFP